MHSFQKKEKNLEKKKTSKIKHKMKLKVVSLLTQTMASMYVPFQTTNSLNNLPCNIPLISQKKFKQLIKGQNTPIMIGIVFYTNYVALESSLNLPKKWKQRINRFSILMTVFALFEMHREHFAHTFPCQHKAYARNRVVNWSGNSGGSNLPLLFHYLFKKNGECSEYKRTKVEEFIPAKVT